MNFRRDFDKPDRLDRLRLTLTYIHEWLRVAAADRDVRGRWQRPPRLWQIG